MANLALLTVELLSDITDLLYGEQIGRLWLCGSTLLNQKLREGGVRSFFFYVPPSVPLAHKVPRLLPSFKQLRHFVVHVHSLAHGANASEDWASIPKSVEKLSILTTYNTPHLVSFFKTSPPPLPHLKELTFRLHRAELKSLFSELDECLPNLEKLLLIQRASYTITVPDFIVTHLPRTLTSFSVFWPDLQFVAPVQDVLARREEWPPALHTLKLTQVPHDFNLECLPRRLTDLGLESVYSAPMWTIDWRMLPPALESLSLQFFSDVELAIPNFPPSLQKTLTRLNTGFGVSNIAIDAEEQAKRALNYARALPPILTSLAHNFADTLDETLLATLPRTLRDFRSIAGVGSQHLPFIPERVSSLGLDLQRYSWAPNASRISDHVLSLHIITKDIVVPRVRAPDDIPRWTMPVLSALPRFLTQLTLVVTGLSSKQVALFPATLINIELQRRMPLRSEKCFMALPAQQLEQLSVAAGTLVAIPLTSAPTYFCRRMTNLYLDGVAIPDQAWFADLPPTLLSLTLAYAGTISARNFIAAVSSRPRFTLTRVLGHA